MIVTCCTLLRIYRPNRPLTAPCRRQGVNPVRSLDLTRHRSNFRPFHENRLYTGTTLIALPGLTFSGSTNNCCDQAMPPISVDSRRGGLFWKSRCLIWLTISWIHLFGPAACATVSRPVWAVPALPGLEAIFLLDRSKKDGFLSAIHGKLPGTYIIYPVLSR